jgi:hypothetical protein
MFPLVDELNIIERELYACPTMSLEVLAIKARVARQYLDTPEDISLDYLAFQALVASIAALAEGRA